MPKRKRRCYPTNEPTDLTDDQWAAIEPIVTTSSPKGGRPTEMDRRAIMHVISKHRTGCHWHMHPKDVPSISAGRYSCDQWRRDRTFVRIDDAPRKHARQALERDEAPSVSVLDSQSVKTTEAGGEHSDDGEKKINGRKRQFWVDTNGFLLRVLVHAADISDTEGAEWLLSEHHHRFPRMAEIRVDQGDKAGLERCLAQHHPYGSRSLKSRRNKKVLRSFRSVRRCVELAETRWNARLPGRDAIDRRVVSITATQNRVRRSSISVRRQCY